MKYALRIKELANDNNPPIRFFFSANDMQEATNKAAKWAHKKGLNYRLDVKVTEANPQEVYHYPVQEI
jgi:hypothetical protein